MLQYEVRFLTKLPDHCGVIKWTNFRYRAECDTKKCALPKGGTRGRGLFDVVARSIFALGGGHRFLCDDKGIGEHREYFNIECEANLFRGVIGLGHDFQCCCIPCLISC